MHLQFLKKNQDYPAITPSICWFRQTLLLRRFVDYMPEFDGLPLPVDGRPAGASARRGEEGGVVAAEPLGRRPPPDADHVGAAVATIGHHTQPADRRRLRHAPLESCRSARHIPHGR
jgi:hypothetical protein